MNFIYTRISEKPARLISSRTKEEKIYLRTQKSTYINPFVLCFQSSVLYRRHLPLTATQVCRDGSGSKTPSLAEL